MIYAGPEEAQAGIKIVRRNINNLKYADNTTLIAESEELKILLMNVKKEREKVGLELNVQKTKTMGPSPITSWLINGETVETVADFIFGGSKITADGNSSHEIKMLTPWKESYEPPRQHLGDALRHYLTNKCPSSQGYGFSSGHVLSVGLWRNLSAEELMLLNCGIGEDSWESLGLQGDPISPS